MEQIQSFFPQHLRPFRRNMLREYLQFKILEAVFATDQGRLLAFLGGTAIHIVHGNQRFSEDLDFDSRDLSADEFERMATAVRKALIREGYTVELSMSLGDAFRANIRFIGLLQDMGISGHREEKLLIHLNAEPQHVEYKPDRYMLNQFDVFCRITVVPADILLAQKILCILERPRAIGRDFYDVIFLWGKTRPNADYLTRKTGIRNESELWERLESRGKALDLEKLASDLEPFVADPSEARKVLLFREFIAMKRHAS